LEELDVINYLFIREVERKAGRIDGVIAAHIGRRLDGLQKAQTWAPTEGAREWIRLWRDLFAGDSETDLLAASSVGCPAVVISEDRQAKVEELWCRPFGAFPSRHAATQFVIGSECKI